MPYSLDFRQKVINFVENGGTITKAAHTFGIGRASIYRQLSRQKLSATKVKSRRNFIKKFGSKSLVFIDESGFEDNQDCIYAWSKKGKKVYGEQEGKRGKRENLVVGIIKKKRDLMAQIIIKGNLNAVGYEQSLNQHLLPSLKNPSVLIMDNSPIHIKTLLYNQYEQG